MAPWVSFIGSAPLRLPFALVSLALCVVLLIPVAVDHDSRASEVVVASLMIAWFAVAFVVFVYWTRYLFEKTQNTSDLLWGVADVVLGIYFSLASLGMATWLFNHDIYVAIDAAESRYVVFFGDFFYMAVLAFNSVGLHITGPRPTRIFGQLWIIVCSTWGTTVLALFMGIVVMQIRIVRKKKKISL